MLCCELALKKQRKVEGWGREGGREGSGERGREIEWQLLVQ